MIFEIVLLSSAATSLCLCITNYKIELLECKSFSTRSFFFCKKRTLIPVSLVHGNPNKNTFTAGIRNNEKETLKYFSNIAKIKRDANYFVLYLRILYVLEN